MKYIIHQVKLPINKTRENLPQAIRKKLNIKKLDISSFQIVKESLDARKKDSIFRVYSVVFETETKLDLDEAPDTAYSMPELKRKSDKRPVIVGFGPCGMFCALTLARAGLKPVVLERGEEVDARTRSVEEFWKGGRLNTDSNVQFGEGGAGTFSDGKLTTGIKDIRINKVLKDLVSFGAHEDIAYAARPHIGTDVLRVVVKNLREEVKRLGGTVLFNTCVTDIVTEEKKNEISVNGRDVEETPKSLVISNSDTDEHQAGENRVTGVKLKFRDTDEEVPAYPESLPIRKEADEYVLETDTVVFAIGHSARDTFRTLYADGIAMEQKPFSIGVRIEHSQELIDRAQYGAPHEELGLPPADYKLNHRCENGRGVYTFCMCPGGEVVLASSQRGGVVTNGMSYRNRDSGKANSALLVDVRTSDFGTSHALGGVEFQEKYEHLAYLNGLKAAGAVTDDDTCGYRMPASSWGELRDGRAPYVEGSIPSFALDAMREAMPHLGRKLRGFDSDDAKVYAVEARSSSPVRFARHKESYIGKIRIVKDSPDHKAEDEGEAYAWLRGFYPAGEGAGYAGGIMSAAVDGMRIAEAIIVSE